MAEVGIAFRDDVLTLGKKAPPLVAIGPLGQKTGYLGNVLDTWRLSLEARCSLGKENGGRRIGWHGGKYVFTRASGGSRMGHKCANGIFDIPDKQAAFLDTVEYLAQSTDWLEGVMDTRGGCPSKRNTD